MSTYRCEDFRARLAEAGPRTADSLEWHRHLVDCESCRDQLAAEERLDELIAAVPDPQVPKELALRVKAALEPLRRRQSTLLEDKRLDALLDGVPVPSVPEGLSQRVLARLEAERAPAPFTRLRARGLLVAAAAVLLFVFALGRMRDGSTSDEDLQELAYFREEIEGEDELVVYALENWELLMSNEIEVYLASLDPEEQALFELELLDDPAVLLELEPETEQAR